MHPGRGQAQSSSSARDLPTPTSGGAASRTQSPDAPARQVCASWAPTRSGVVNNYSHFNTAFVEIPFPKRFLPVSLIAQTGFIQVASRNLAWRDIGKAIDVGNSCDVDIADALDYLGDDPETQVIVIHMEGLKRGPEFLEAAGRVSRKKPVIVLKTGHSPVGAKAALSHSGSLVGEDHVYDAAFKRAGLLRVRTSVEMRDAIHALAVLGEMKGPRIGVVTVTGAGRHHVRRCLRGIGPHLR